MPKIIHEDLLMVKKYYQQEAVFFFNPAFLEAFTDII